MFKKIFFNASVLAIAVVFISSAKIAIAQSSAIKIINPTSMERPDELVVLKRSDIQKKLPGIKFIHATGNGKALSVQHDDTNGDGNWDEAVFLYSFKPDDKVTVILTGVDTLQATGLVQRAHVRLRRKNADDTFGPNIKKETMPVKNPATDFLRAWFPSLYSATSA